MSESQLTGFLQQYRYTLMFGGIFFIYLCNLFIDVMDVDAGQYASISMEMSQTNSYLHIYHRGADYLDKPPLLFWLSSISMKLFGINNFAYKFPSFLLAILGVYSTFKFAKLYYSKETATLAALILASTQALFLITNDVRTDTILLALVAFSVWQLAAYLKNNSWKNLILGFVGIAFAMMAKGPIGIVAVVAALGFDLLIKLDWRSLFKWQWLVGLIIVAILLIPLTWGLYTQFDLHPEKTAYGIKSPSGVRFFYWTQSFGRITGESAWKDDNGYFFFVHSILWDFQPWIIFLVLGLITGFNKLIKFFRKKIDAGAVEFMSLGGFVLVFCALSLSSYKLPHYIFVTFPFAAVLAAQALVKIKEQYRWSIWVQAFLNIWFWIVIVLGGVLFFPYESLLLPAIFSVLFIFWIVSWFKISCRLYRLVVTTVLTSFAFNLNLAVHFYPTLIGNYQATGKIGKRVYQEQIPMDKFVFYRAHDHTLDFYRKGIVNTVYIENLSSLEKGTWVYTNADGYKDIRGAKLDYKLIGKYEDYPVAQLKIPFLMKETRHEQLSYSYLLEKQ